MERKPFSSLAFVAAEILLIITLTFPKIPFRRVLFFPVIAYLYLHNVIWRTTGNVGGDWGVGSLLMTRALTASDFILLESFNPPKLRDSEVANKISPAGLPVWKRVTRSIALIWNPRGIGWNYRVPYTIVPAQGHTSRGSFIRARILRLLVLYLLLDAKESIQHLTPNFQNSMDAKPGTPPLLEQNYATRLMIIFWWAVSAFSVLDAQLVVISLVSVALGVSEPKDWPNMMGDIRGAWSIRRVWGHVWHQMFRQIFLSHARFVSQTLGIQPASSLDKPVTVVIAFVVSTLIHSVGGDYMVANTVTLSSPFFLSQPLGIAFESLVMHLFGGLIPPKWIWLKRMIGYLWVAAWFSWTVAGTVDGLLRAGLGGAELLPFSIWRGIGMGKWSTSS